MGDVMALYTSPTNVVARYHYGPWGELLYITNGSNANVSSDPTHIANINLIRYRGYYYDTETGFYFLQSRYYDPQTHRFINADSVVSNVGGNILGYNLYAYCRNNPLNMEDSGGNWPKLSTVFAAIAVTAAAVAVVAAVVATCGVAAPALAVASGGIISGVSDGTAATALNVATGAVIVTGVSATAAIVTDKVENTNFSGPVRNNSVYVMRDKSTGDVKYVGRTNNPQRRQREHDKDPRKADLQPMEVKYSDLSKSEARMMEQLLISAYTLENLANARREISVGNIAGFSNKMGNIVGIFDGAVESELLDLMGR